MNTSLLTHLRRLLPALAVTVLATVLLPSILGSFWLKVMTSAAIYALASVGVGVLYGRLGLVSLTNYGLLGVGGWVALRLSYLWDMPFLVHVLLGGVVAAMLGTVIGLPALRLRGLYLALVTLMTAGAIAVAITALGFPSGGTGFNGQGGGASISSMARPSIATGDAGYFRFVMVIVALGFIVVFVHLETKPGRAWAMIRRSQAAALSAGVNVTLYKTWAFTLAGFLAGTSGGLLAGSIGSLFTGDFGASASMLLFGLTVSAGAFHLFGSVLAGLLGRALPALFDQWKVDADLANMIFGFLLLLSLTAAPQGAAGQLIGVGKLLWSKVRPGRTAATTATAAAAAEGGEPSVPDVPADEDRRVVDTAVVLRNVTVQFGGVRPLNGLDLALQGDIVGIVGPNGAGKTTLLNVLSGFVTPVEGEVEAGGVRLSGMNPYERARWGVRRTFQTEQVVDELTVVENVDVMLDSLPMHHGEREGAVARALALTGLSARAHRPARELNAYERRMVEIARAIVGEPKVILMDEPAAGLSEHETRQFERIVKTLPGRTGATILLIDHDVALIAAVCERTAVLDFGELIAYGPTAEVLEDPKVMAAYLGVSDAELDALDELAHHGRESEEAGR